MEVCDLCGLRFREDQDVLIFPCCAACRAAFEAGCQAGLNEAAGLVQPMSGPAEPTFDKFGRNLAFAWLLGFVQYG
jgi:hypothetical protein